MSWATLPVWYRAPSGIGAGVITPERKALKAARADGDPLLHYVYVVHIIVVTVEIEMTGESIEPVEETATPV